MSKALFNLVEAAEYIGYSRTRLYSILPTLDTRKAGRRTLVTRESLDAHVAALPKRAPGEFNGAKKAAENKLSALTDRSRRLAEINENGLAILDKLRHRAFRFDEISGPAPGDTRPNYDKVVVDQDLADAHDWIEARLFGKDGAC